MQKQLASALAVTFALAVPAQSRPQASASKAIVDRLRSVEPEERAAAIPAVIALGAAALPDLEALVFALDVRDESEKQGFVVIGFRRDVRLDALRVPPESLLPPDRFSSGDDVPESEFEAIAIHDDEIGAVDAEALDAIASCLHAIGPAALPLLGRMLADPARAHAAASVLGRFGAPALATARAALADERPAVRGEACRILGWLGSSVPAEVQERVVQCIAHDAASVHKRAVWATVRFGAAATPFVAKALETATPEAQIRYVGTLALLGPAALPTSERLLALAGTGSGRAKAWACDALGRMHLDGELLQRALPLLTDALVDRPEALTLTACEALGRLGPAAASALPRITELAKSNHEDVRTAATSALGGIGGEAARLALLARLDDASTRVRRAAVTALTGYGTLVLPALLERFDAKDAPMLDLVAEALVGIGEPAVTALLTKAKSAPAHVRRAATLALGRLAATAPSALAGLDAVLQAPDDPMRLVAIEALGGIGPRSANTALQRLLPLLRDESPYARVTAVHAIGKLGPSARAAVPPLMDALSDAVIDVQIAAAEALAAVGPDARAALTILRQLALDAPAPLQTAARTATRCIGANPSPR